MRKKNHRQLKVGIFINLGLILFTIAVLALRSKEGLLSKAKTYYVLATNAGGILRGANVLLAGVPVGTVAGFDLRLDAPPVRIKLSIASKYARLIRADTTAEIITQGAVGESIVSLSAGDSSKPQIPPNQIIPFRQGASLNRTIGKVDIFLENLTHLTSRLDQNLKGERLAKVFDSLERILEKVDHGSGTISAFLNDPELYDDAKALVGETNENRIVRNLVRKAIRDSERNRAPAGKANEGNSK